MKKHPLEIVADSLRRELERANAEHEALKASSIELAHRYAGLKAEHEALEARCDHLEKERARLLEVCELNNSTIEIYKRLLGERE